MKTKQKHHMSLRAQTIFLRTGKYLRTQGPPNSTNRRRITWHVLIMHPQRLPRNPAPVFFFLPTSSSGSPHGHLKRLQLQWNHGKKHQTKFIQNGPNHFRNYSFLDSGDFLVLTHCCGFDGGCVHFFLCFGRLRAQMWLPCRGFYLAG